MDIYNYNLTHSGEILTNFTPGEILKLINERLLEFSNPNNFTITEEVYDPLYDKFEQRSSATKIWNIEFYKPVNIPSNVIVVRFIIRVTHLQETNGVHNLVTFADISNVKGSMCDDRIFSLKYFITKKEKELILRYFEREPLLLVVEGSIINYDDFSDKDLNKINEEKKTSKKRRVLENPWLLREFSEYIDFIPPKIDISVLKRCF